MTAYHSVDVDLRDAKAPSHQAEPPSAAVELKAKRLRAALLVVGCALALLNFAGTRTGLNPDGISYLDLSDDLRAGRWQDFVNAHWSPMYPALLAAGLALLRPEPLEEFTAPHVVNLGIFLFTLMAFEAFRSSLILFQRRIDKRVGERGDRSELGLTIILYLVFYWASIHDIEIAMGSPDLLLMGFILLAAAHTLRIAAGAGSVARFAALGLTLGLGYYAKSPILPLAILFIITAALAMRSVRLSRRLLCGAVAFTVCVIAVTPWVLALHAKYGRYTVGDTGKLNIAWHVNKTAPYALWQGGKGDAGIPDHPPRKVSSDPEIYEFATPVVGTYPPWKDPAYWMAGIKIHFNPSGHARQAIQSLDTLRTELCSGLYGWLLILPLLFLGLECERVGWRKALGSALKRGLDYWPLWAPALAAIVMFSVVLIEIRYVSAFLLLIYSAALAATRPSWPLRSDRAGLLVAAALALCFTQAYAPRFVKDISSAVNPTHPRTAAASYKPYYEMAAALSIMGATPGSTVAVQSPGFSCFWARLARLRIVAELGTESASPNSPTLPTEEALAQVLARFQEAGARYAVPRLAPDVALKSGATSLGKSGFYGIPLNTLKQPTTNPDTPVATQR